MTKFFSAFFTAIILLPVCSVLAEEATPVTTETVAAETEVLAEETKDAIPANAVEVVSAVTAAAAEVPDLPAPPPAETPALAEVVAAPEILPVATEAIPTDNLEFISGEISSADETAQSVTVKLYGEAESGASDKTLKVTVDGTTDITDGEQDRDLKSLTAGTEVDVEYDPATNKATYIFVY